MRSLLLLVGVLIAGVTPFVWASNGLALLGVLIVLGVMFYTVKREGWR